MRGHLRTLVVVLVAVGLLALFLFLTLVFFLTQILIRGDWVLANMPFAPPEMKAAVDEATAKIISGEIKVHDFRSDNACPV